LRKLSWKTQKRDATDQTADDGKLIMLRINDVLPDVAEFPEIPAKSDPFGGVYMGDGIVMTRLWTEHLFLTSSGDMIVTPHLLSLGMNEPHNTRILMSVTNPGDVFVDIGANVGYFTVLGAWRAYPGGQVWAFEPIPKLYRIMSDNLHNNGFSMMAERRQLGLSDRTGVAQLRIFEGYEATSTMRELSADFISVTEQQTGRQSHVIDCNIVRLDDEMSDVKEINVLKIDAEGHEPSIIRGAQKILARSGNIRIVMEFVPSIMGEVEAAAHLKLLRDLDFSIFRIESDASLIEFRDDNELMAIPFSDLLLVKL
jgi:FkbM family methyltransferase